MSWHIRFKVNDAKYHVFHNWSQYAKIEYLYVEITKMRIESFGRR